MALYFLSVLLLLFYGTVAALIFGSAVVVASFGITKALVYAFSKLA